MRKKSRQMDAEWALGVLDRAPYVTVSMTEDDGTPYGLPLSLARTDEKTFYFHCAMVKITLTAPPTGKRKQYDKQGEELKYGRME